MNRRIIDLLLSWTGLVVAVVLLVAGGLLLYGSSFVKDQVHDQLATQKIFFPLANSDAVKGPQFAAMRQYGGQQFLTGPQAETYANHFIAVHLSEVAGGKTYSQVSAAALADPKNAALKEQVQTLFQGTTLRGLLLNAYAFWTVGVIARSWDRQPRRRRRSGCSRRWASSRAARGLSVAEPVELDRERDEARPARGLKRTLQRRHQPRTTAAAVRRGGLAVSPGVRTGSLRSRPPGVRAGPSRALRRACRRRARRRPAVRNAAMPAAATAPTRSHRVGTTRGDGRGFSSGDCGRHHDGGEQELSHGDSRCDRRRGSAASESAVSPPGSAL